jgi:hypothetical protein
MYTPGDRGDQALARQNQVERHVQVQVARQAEEVGQAKMSFPHALKSILDLLCM